MNTLNLYSRIDLKSMLNGERGVEIYIICQKIKNNRIILNISDKELLQNCVNNNEYINFEE